MTKPDSAGAEYDILPRDQLEHYKLEVARLRTENERLIGEVDYLRQALAAALSKVPQLEGPTSSTAPVNVNAAAISPRWPWQAGASPSSYVRYFSLISLLASPMVLIVILLLGLICAILFSVSMWFLPNYLP